MMSTPLAANTVDAAALADELARFRILPPERLSDLLADFSGGGPAALAEFLVARGALTPFQADRVLAGETRALALGPYRLTGPLRRGPLGPVFRAEKGDKAFVVRVLPLRSLWQARQAKHLVRALGSLPPHPVVAPLVDADSANGYHYLVWPLTPGELLTELVRIAGPVLPAEAASLLGRLAAALAACHARHVVHGLLTPDAVAYGADNSPYLLELGAGTLLARNLAAKESLFDTFSSAAVVAGVLGYAAPEWVADPTCPTPAGDQYALGAVGYFALTGRPPPLTGAPPVAEGNPAVPAGLAATIDRLLRPDPADRFSGMDEVREVFAELAGYSAPPDPSDDVSAVSPLAASCHSGGRIELSTQGGMISWGSPGPAQARLPERDDSDSSIRFDLPASELEPHPAAAAKPVAASSPPAPVSQPSAGNPDQLPDRPVGLEDTPRAVDTQLPKVPAPRSSRLLDPLNVPVDLSSLPVLPAIPLLHATSASPPLPLPPSEPDSPDPQAAGAEKTPSGSVLWKKVKRKVLFWQTPTDVVQVSVFGPPSVAHGHTPQLTVYLYPPDAAESVGTLARAFQHEAVLLATGALTLEVDRGDRLAVHLAVAHAAVTNPLASFSWRGQPHRLTFDLVIPWEVPAGPAVGVVSVGREDVRIGKAEFHLPILDGKS